MCIYVYSCSYHCFDISNALKCIVQASISHFYEDLIEQNNHIYICITGHLTHVKSWAFAISFINLPLAHLP